MCTFNTVPEAEANVLSLIIDLSRPHSGCDIPLYELAQTYSRLCPLSSDPTFLFLLVAINFHVRKAGGKMGGWESWLDNPSTYLCCSHLKARVG